VVSAFNRGREDAVAAAARRVEEEATDKKRESQDAADVLRKQREKHAAEVQKDQNRLIGKCTHSRNGKSVFVGSFPKKMCLMCRVKLDLKSGLFVPM
jgi:hypothetical protein